MGLEKEHQEITLPECGEKVTVRHLRTLDYNFIGIMPDTLLATFVNLAGKKDVSVQDFDPETTEYMIAACIRGIVKHPGNYKLVSKQPVDCEGNEFSFYDLKNEDQAALMDAIFSGGEGLPLNFPEEVVRQVRERQERENEKQAQSAN